jgi:hypothetical protein
MELMIDGNHAARHTDKNTAHETEIMQQQAEINLATGRPIKIPTHLLKTYAHRRTLKPGKPNSD